METITKADLEWAFSEIVEELNQSNSELRKLKETVEDQDKELRTLRGQNLNFQRQDSMLQRLLEEKQCRINELTEQLASREAEKILSVSDVAVSPLP